MIISNIKLLRWKNFSECNVDLGKRCFVVGANASGKSNFLDAFRFLHDIVKQGGGLQEAIRERDGMKNLKCLSSRRQPGIEIIVEMKDDVGDTSPKWRYELAFSSTAGGAVKDQPRIVYERVFSGAQGKYLPKRDKTDSNEDSETLKYTHLEQATMNGEFREIKSYFESMEYLNIIPQLVRESGQYSRKEQEDYYGRNFLAQLARLNTKTRKSYLKQINEVLKLAVPQLSDLDLVKDINGIPHLEVKYNHWRQNGAKQEERQLSDGTLRLIGFLFSMLNAKGMLLLEEPESNLHTAIVEKLPEYIARMQQTKKRGQQVIVTTHSYEILSRLYDPAEVVLLRPTDNGTEAVNVSRIEDVRNELNAGLGMADAVLPYTRPADISELST